MQLESPSIAWIPRPSRWPVIGALVAAVVCIVLPAFRLFVLEGYGVVALFVFGVAAAVMRGHPIAGSRHQGNPGRVRVDDRVHLGDRSYERAFIESGWSDANQAVVRFRDGSHAVIELEDARAASALLAELGIGRRVISIPVGLNGSPISRGALAVLAIGLGVLGVPPMLFSWIEMLVRGFFFGAAVVAIPLGIILYCELLFVRSLVGRTLRLGTDGVEVVAIRRQYLPFEELGEVRTDGRQLWLGWLRIPTSSAREAAALATQVRRARREQGTSEEIAVRLLSRDRRTLETWRDEVSRLRADAYRGVTDEALATVVADPSSPPDARMAAALSHASEDVRAKLRVEVESIADRHLRLALERAIEGEIDERALDRAMRRMME